jgi:hypothetical protein
MSSQHAPLQVVPRARLRSAAGLGFEVTTATASLHAVRARWPMAPLCPAPHPNLFLLAAKAHQAPAPQLGAGV